MRSWRAASCFGLALSLSLARCECSDDIQAYPAPDVELTNLQTNANNRGKEPLEFQFGDVEPGNTITQKMRVHNRGNATLMLKSYGLHSDPTDERCPSGSAEFELQPAPEKLDPGKKSELNIVYVPRDGGPDCAILLVQSNDPEDPEQRVYLYGRGAAPKLCASSSVIDFGEVPINTYVTEDVELTNCGTKPLTFQAMTPVRSFPPFAVDAAPSLPHGPMQPGDSVTLTFGFEAAEPRAYTDEASGAGLVQLDAVGPVNPQSFLVLKAVATTPPTCDVDVVPRSVQFGHVRPGQEKSFEVAVQNRGRLDCEIRSITRTEGSDAFTLTNGAAPPSRTLAAGALETITFTFAPQDSAVLSAVYTLESDDPVEGSIEIHLEGDGTIPEGCFMEADPLALNFGTASTSQTATLPVSVVNVGDDECRVTATEVVTGAPDFFANDPGLPVIGLLVPSGSSTELNVGFRPLSEGFKQGRLQVSYKAMGFGGTTQTLNVELYGNAAAPKICVNPEELDFGTLAAGQRVCKDIEISNCGATELRLRGVSLQSGSSPAFTMRPPDGLPLALGPGETATVNVCYQPTDGGGDLGVVQIISDDPDDNSVAVVLRGNAAALCPPYLECAPDPLEMGDIAVDSGATRTVVCTNFGSQVVTVSGVTITGAPYEVSAVTPTVLGPGDQLALQVTFPPGYMGSYTARVDVRSDACTPVIAVDVVARGVEPPLPNCIPPRTFSPAVLWRWEHSSVEPFADQVWATPLVANMSDDNGDGLVDVNDVPDVIFTTFDGREFAENTSLANSDHMNDPIRAYLRIVSGDDGHELVSVGGEDHAMDSETNPAVADIDGDNMPEVVNGKWLVLEGEADMGGGPKLRKKFTHGYLIAFEHDGTFKWVSEEWIGDEDTMENAGQVSIADMDHDGFPEITFGLNVFDRNGHRLWHAEVEGTDSGHGWQSFPLNVDNQGDMELVCGNAVLRSDGSVMWQRSDIRGGNPAVADLNLDGTPELVLRNDQLHILNAVTGATVAGPFDIPNPNPDEEGEGGVIPTIPAIADFDGDGRPEIAVPNQSALVVFEMDGTVLWMADIWDGSGMAGAAAFDFEGDGVYEVVYSDETDAWAFRGTDGTPIYQADRSSRTIAEISTVADINNDGQAEMVVVFNEPLLRQVKGIVAYTNSQGAWVGTRRIYNQQAYHVTNVDESGVVPREEPAHWLQGTGANSFHANIPRCEP